MCEYKHAKQSTGFDNKLRLYWLSQFKPSQLDYLQSWGQNLWILLFIAQAVQHPLTALLHIGLEKSFIKPFSSSNNTWSMVVGDGGVRKLVSKSESVCRPIALVSLIFVSRNCERVCLSVSLSHRVLSLSIACFFLWQARCDPGSIYYIIALK